MPVAESAVAVIGRTPDPFQPLPARSTPEFGPIHKKGDRPRPAGPQLQGKRSYCELFYVSYRTTNVHCGSFIARTVSKIIRKTGNPPHRNGINRHHAAEKPQDVPPICIPGRHPLSLQASIGPLPAFPGKAETGIPPRSPALRRPNPKRPTFSRTLGRSLSTPSESGRRPDSNLFHTFLLWQNSKDSSSTARPRRPAAK